MTVKVIDVDYWRSPLVQGGLEIPVLVSVAMNCSDSNKGYIKKLEILSNEYYKVPVNGKFEDATEAILRTVHSDDDSTDYLGKDEVSFIFFKYNFNEHNNYLKVNYCVA